ncbi:MAG: CotH kinase family protein [Bacteroidales bacterium]
MKYILLAFLFIISGIVYTQPAFPDDGIVFNDSLVSRVDITINPDTLEWIYNNVDSNQEFHADFIFTSGNYIDTIQNIGFRLRGNTSRNAAKKSFKISFNTFEPGRKWHGLEKLNLNGEHNDPSISRSKINWDLLRQFNIPASRSNHVEVYINDNYYGLYLNVEHTDEEFVESRFGNKNGNLFKCLYPADLDYKGSNPNLYKEEYWGRRAYDLKTNTAADDYSDLAHFIDVLNNSTSAGFLCEMEKVFNIYDYLKILVIDVFTGNWDGYPYNQNNFYLYHNTETDKFEYIPYDLDNTLGIDWIGRDWANRDVYDWQQHGDNVRPLYTRIINNNELRDQYSFYFNQFLQNFINSNFYNKLEQLRAKLEPYVINDPFYPMDYGFDIDDFNASFEDGTIGHVTYGIELYCNTRKYSALSQLDVNNINPVINYISHVFPLPGEDLWVKAFVEDEDTSPDVTLVYSINGGDLLSLVMHDDGNHQDGESNDGIYGGVVLNIPWNTAIEYQVTAEDEFGYSSFMPCDPVHIDLYPSNEPELFINEIMASNSTTIADEYGEYDDWVEIYNGGTENIWMGDKYLSDNPANPDKWQFPDITLLPGAHLMIWTDNDEDQGTFHTNFKLDVDGEEIGLYDSETTAFFPIDTLSYGPQQTDISFGRKTDGGSAWVFFTNPTPNSSNIFEAIAEFDERIDVFQIYPNPVKDEIVYFNKPVDLLLLNSMGETVMNMKQTNSINTKELIPGIYYILTSAGKSTKLIIQ